MPADWVPKNRIQLNPILSLEPGMAPPSDMDLRSIQPEPEVVQASIPEPEDPADHVEDEVQRKLSHLVSVFPNTDPEFLHEKVLEFADKEDQMARWIDETLENKADGLPTRKDYEKRVKVKAVIDFLPGFPCNEKLRHLTALFFKSL